MKCSLLCTYNKHKKTFSWNNSNEDIDDVDDLFRRIIIYTKNVKNRRNIVKGYEACLIYINYLKSLQVEKKTFKLEDIEVFWNFKTHIRNLIFNIFNGYYVVTNVSICNEYLEIYDKCDKIIKSNHLDCVAFLESIELLHQEEQSILGKACGLRVIKNAK